MKGMIADIEGANTSAEAGFSPAENKGQGTCMNPKCGKPLDLREARLVSWEGRFYFFCSELEAVLALDGFQSSQKASGPISSANAVKAGVRVA